MSWDKPGSKGHIRPPGCSLIIPALEHPMTADVVSLPQLKNCFIVAQIRNSKVGHLCMDQGIKENHTATLHPCHGWGPQVQEGWKTVNSVLIHNPVDSLEFLDRLTAAVSCPSLILLSWDATPKTGSSSWAHWEAPGTTLAAWWTIRSATSRSYSTVTRWLT